MLDLIRPHMLDLVLPIIVVVTVFFVIRVTGRENPIEGLKRKWPIVGAMVIAAIGIGVGLQIGLMRLTAPDVDEIIAGDPLLSLVLETFPEQGPTIRERISHAAAEGDETLTREAIAIGHEIGTTLMPRLIGSVSDDGVIGFIDAFTTSMEAASRQGGEVCMSYLTGGAGGAPMPSFSSQTEEAMNAAVTRLLVEGAAGAPQRQLDGATRSALIAQAADRAFALAGDRPLDFDAYANLMAPHSEQTKQQACWAALYIHMAIRELPPAKAAALYRSIMTAL